jgi:hypothetical protein
MGFGGGTMPGKARRARGVHESNACAACLRRQIAGAEAEIARLAQKYGVSSPAELRAAVDTGQLPEHPTWEDIIGWNNLISFVEHARRAASGGSGSG